MNPIIIEQNTVRYEINPKVLLNNMLQQRSQINLDDYINHRPSYNVWAVQFSNIQGYLKSYIKQLFSHFGRIDSVVQARTSSMMYVNFASEYEAKRCVMGLMNQSYIQLRPFFRNNFNNINGNSFPQQNGSQSIAFNHQPNGLSSFAASSHQKNSKNFFLPKNDITDRDMRNANNVNASVMENSFLSEAGTNNSQDSSTKTCSCQYSQGSNQSIDKIRDDHRADSIAAVNEETIDSKISFQSREKVAEGIGQKLEEIAVDLQEKPQIIITAQEVIVGNIDEAHGAPYILHLLEKYQPICISSIQTAWKHSLRYCHVYFKTPAHAEAAEANWDGIELNGKKLIVMRPHVLAIQARQK